MVTVTLYGDIYQNKIMVIFFVYLRMNPGITVSGNLL